MSGTSNGAWLFERAADKNLSAKMMAVVEVLAAQPRMSSYSAAPVIAEAARVNVSTVIRTAQALGFSGWPVMQTEIRARYLASLSVPEIAAEHESDVAGVIGASLSRDVEALLHTSRHIDQEALLQIAEAIAASRRTLVVAEGSFNAIGWSLAHNATLAGYPVTVPNSLTNSLATLGDGDVLIAVILWRQHERTFRAANAAKDRGATVCVITDSGSSQLSNLADLTVTVPSESASFFPSLTAAMAVSQALIAQLAALDPERTRENVARSEELWDEFEVLHVPRRSP